MCPLCTKEISLLKRLTKGSINFIDVHTASDNNIPDKESLLKRLHFHKVDGQWLVGLDANIFIWSQTPYGYLFKVLSIRPIRLLADSVYNRWADRRFKKRYQCRECIVE
jgi:predicted DCC family thiol-disulfide oxidoreductase YuxK